MLLACSCEKQAASLHQRNLPVIWLLRPCVERRLHVIALQRTAKPIASPVTPQQQRGDVGGGAFGSPASLGSGPGYSTRVVSTPEQLQRYMVGSFACLLIGSAGSAV